MTSSLALGPALWLDGPTYSEGTSLNQYDVAARAFNTPGAQVYGGVFPSGGQLVVSAGSGMAVNVGTGYCVAPSSTGSTSGGYLFGNMSAGSLTVSTSDPTNPRIDMIAAYVSDVGTSSSFSAIEILTGTPTSGANLTNLNGAPSAPSNSVVLAYLLVPANATSITSGDLANIAPLTVSQGGIIPVAAANAPTGYTGAMIYDTTSGSFKHNPAAGPAQAKVLPWAPQYARVTSNQNLSGTTTLCSVSITVDGSTDIEIIGGWSAISNLTHTAYPTVAVYTDSTYLADINCGPTQSGPAGSAPQGAGGTIHHVTGGGSGTPGAGTHTIKLTAAPNGAAGTTYVAASSTSPITLCVKPVCR